MRLQNTTLETLQDILRILPGRIPLVRAVEHEVRLFPIFLHHFDQLLEHSLRVGVINNTIVGAMCGTDNLLQYLVGLPGAFKNAYRTAVLESDREFIESADTAAADNDRVGGAYKEEVATSVAKAGIHD